MRRKAFVEIGVISGDDAAGGLIGADHFFKREARLGDSGLRQRVVEVVIVIKRGRGRGVFDFAEVDPVIEKRVAEALRLGIGEESLGLCAQSGGLAQLAPRGARAESGIGRRIPEEKCEPDRERGVVEPAGFLVEKHKSRRREHRSISRHHGFGETQTGALAFIEEREETRDVGLGNGAAVRAVEETAEQARGVAVRII